MDNPNPPPPSLDDQEESVRIAVRALGDMRNGSYRAENSRQPHTLSISSPSSSQPPNSAPSPSTSPRRQDSTPVDAVNPSSPAFVARMTSFPLVGSALRVYEQGKANSRVVKYGAAMVESSVRTLSRPVIDRLPVNVNQLDEFACRQLDRLDSYRRPAGGESASPSTSAASPIAVEPSKSPERGRQGPRNPGASTDVDEKMDQSPSRAPDAGTQGTASEGRMRKGWKEGGERGVPSWLEANHSYAAVDSADIRPSERSVTPTQGRDDSRTPSDPQNDQQIAQRSRWQAVLLEAGGLSAALSEDSMRRLKYCLQWLQYATAHIDAQILIIREFTASLQTYPPDAPPHARRPNPISEEHLKKLAEVRKDVVQTVRQVVDVVSKYAGGALPEPARSTVRGFILKLPQRWATKAGVPTNGATLNPLSVATTGVERESVSAAGSGTGATTTTRRTGARRAAHRERGAGAEGEREYILSAQSSRAPSPSSPRVPRATIPSISQVHQQEGPVGGAPNGATVSHGAAMVAAQRLLSLATESLDMMRGVTGVVKDSLDRAESWVSRLRSVGLQRNGAPEGEEGAEGPAEGGLNPQEVEVLLSQGPIQPGAFTQYRAQHHRRNSSSQLSDEPMSPFFSSASTTTWNSSIPSTPGGNGSGAFTPYNGGISSPGTIVLPPIGQMTIHSRANTPKSVVSDLPEEDEHEVFGTLGMKGFEKSNERSSAGNGIKVVGVDERLDERGQKMDVDGV